MAYTEAQKLGFVVIPAGLVIAVICMAMRTSKRSKPLGEDKLWSCQASTIALSDFSAGTVAGTSALVAAVRAVESSNPEPLFVDPLAEAMAGKDNMDEIRQFIASGESERVNSFPGQKWRHWLCSCRLLSGQKCHLRQVRHSGRPGFACAAGRL